MKAADVGTRRYFFTPDGQGWVLVEALGTREGWEVRQAGRLGLQVLPDVPPVGADWVEARAPARAPRRPKPAAAGPPRAPAAAPPRTPPKPAKAAKPAKPKAKAARARPAVAPEKLPTLSQELEGLLADEQRRRKAPDGMVKCPACGLPIAPTRNKKVRTHDDPVKGARCGASNQPWAQFP